MGLLIAGMGTNNCWHQKWQEVRILIRISNSLSDEHGTSMAFCKV